MHEARGDPLALLSARIKSRRSVGAARFVGTLFLKECLGEGTFANTASAV
jgi:hypothetical protein